MAHLYIYRNLRTGGFSIRHKGLVIERIQEGVAFDVTFKVNEGGRQRVLREKQKNIHSFVVAAGLARKTDRSHEGLAEIKYNPYKQNCFTIDGEPIQRAAAVLFKGGRCYLIGR
jgi:hypothetical protein